MARELILKKCKSCGAMVKVLKDCNCDECGIICCGEQMSKVVPNSVDAAIEKHIPEYTVEGEKILVKVNHVMEEEHYITWIAIESDNQIIKTNLKPHEEPKAVFPYKKDAKIYAYCNNHGLWMTKVD